MEMGEVSYPVKINDGEFPEGSALEKWYDDLV
jgi:hypothetical protein